MEVEKNQTKEIIAGTLRILFFVILGSCSLSQIFPIGDGPQAAAQSPGEEAPFQEKDVKPVSDSMMDRLIRKAGEYERYALKFICTEMARNVTYDISQGEATKEKLETCEYLLESSPDREKLSPYRQKMTGIGSKGERSEVKIEYSFPEAYSWIFIFSKNIRNVMKYGYLGKEIYSYKLAHIISFRGFQPFSDGKDIREWEGRIWIEEGTSNILKVEAEPIHQNDVLEMKRQEYNQAFSFIGIKLKKRPLGYSSIVYFDFEHDGLTFPTESRNATFQLVARNKKSPVSAIIFNYADYHFFKTDTREKMESPR